MDSLGPSIFWLPMTIGEVEGPVPVRNWVVVLGSITTVFLSTGIGPLASSQFFTGGSLRTPAVLHVKPVTIYLQRTIHTTRKAPLLVVNPSVVVWLTGGITPWTITGIYLFINNLCGEFPLVVSVSVIFLLFPSLVRVATNESLFGLLLTSSSSES